MPFATTDQRRAFFDRLASRRLRDERHHSAYYTDRAQWLRRYIPKEASVLQLGCGAGSCLVHLPNTRKTGIDFSSKMIKVAMERDKSSTYLIDDIETLTHMEKYDYVLCIDTVNFLGDIQVGLERMRSQVCHERTRVIITYYNFLWQPLFLVGELLGLKTHFPEQNWLSRSDIDNLLTLTGFQVVQHGERLLFPLNIPLLARFCNRYLVSLPFFRWFALSKYVVARPAQTKQQTYSVTVLSAVRNERGNIQPIVDGMPVLGSSTELLFIEGHSSDGTREELDRVIQSYSGPLKIRALKQPGKGKADALHYGMRESSGQIVVIYDGDFTVHPSELYKLYDAIAYGHAEFVNASRLTYPLSEGAMRLLNLFGNKIFSALFSWLFAQKLVDVLSPLKAFLRADYCAVSTRKDPFGDFDFFLGASAIQRKMREVPIHYLPRSYGTTKLRPFAHGWLLLKLCWFGARRLKWI